MHTHRIGLLLLGVVGLFAVPTYAKKSRSDALLDYGNGCWTRLSEQNASLHWCFQQDGIVEGFAAKAAEGFGEKGIFRSDAEHVVILGFPGNGWPAKQYVEDCRYHFEDDHRVLVLVGCSSAGRWRKADSMPSMP